MGKTVVLILAIVICFNPAQALVVPSMESDQELFCSPKCGGYQRITQEESLHRMSLIIGIVWGGIAFGIAYQEDSDGEKPSVLTATLFATGVGIGMYWVARAGGPIF